MENIQMLYTFNVIKKAKKNPPKQQLNFHALASHSRKFAGLQIHVYVNRQYYPNHN